MSLGSYSDFILKTKWHLCFFLALIITSDLVMDFFVLLVNFSWFLLPLLLFKPNVWFCSTMRRRRWTWYTWVNFGTANNETEHWTKMNWTDRRFELSKVVKLKAIQIHTIKWIQLWCCKFQNHLTQQDFCKIYIFHIPKIIEMKSYDSVMSSTFYWKNTRPMNKSSARKYVL